MKRKFLNAITLLTLTLVPAASLASTVYAAAPSCGTDTSSKGQVLRGIGKTGSECDDKGVSSAIAAIVRILSIVVGIAAVIMIMVSGFRYIVSGGESGKVSSAKTGLIYALVGLAVAAFAQFLVHYVLFQANKT